MIHRFFNVSLVTGFCIGLFSTASWAAPKIQNAPQYTLDFAMKLRGTELRPQIKVQPGVPAVLTQKSQGLDPDLEISVQSKKEKSQVSWNVSIYEWVMGEKVLIAEPQFQTNLKTQNPALTLKDPGQELELVIQPTATR
jgi:hypothetical protein